jgi:hypothetical protein
LESLDADSSNRCGASAWRTYLSGAEHHNDQH